MRSFGFRNGRDCLELAIVIAALEAALWAEGRTQKELSWLAGAVILLIACVDRRSWRARGVRRSELRSFTVAAWASAVALALVIVASWFGSLHVLFGLRTPVFHTVAYLPWAIAQQFILQGVIFVRFETLFKSARVAAFAASLLFGLLHIPNPVLMLVTFCGGFLLCLRFSRDRDVLPLGIAHFIVGVALAVSLPDAVLRHMRVGLGYIHFFH